MLKERFRLTFQKIKTAFLNHRKITITIILEIAAIGVLLILFKDPLTQYLFPNNPSYYSASQMKPKSRYLVQKNDAIVGTGSPGTTVKFYLAPLKKKMVSTINSQGRWIYKISPELPEGKYLLAVAKFNDDNKPIAITTYKLRVKQTSFLYPIEERLKKFFSFKKASAQEPEEDVVSEPVGEVIPDPPEEDTVYEPVDEFIPDPDVLPVVDLLPEEIPDSTDQPPSDQPNYCSEEQWETISCSQRACGEMTQSCSQTGEERGLADLSGLCSDPAINPACNQTTDDIPEVVSPSPQFNTEEAIAKSDPYPMNVLVLKFFPTTEFGKIDISKTGNVGSSVETVAQKTTDITNNLIRSLESASTYLGYKNPEAKPSLKYTVVDEIVYEFEVPKSEFKGIQNYPQYPKILTDANICNYVQNQKVNEVWVFAYHSDTLHIEESRMSSRFGDISNSNRFNDLPRCGSTYRVYTFNYSRGTSEAMESWGHQFEAELDAVDKRFFREKFQGPPHPRKETVVGRCGSVHNPPNAAREYDRDAMTPTRSDCLDWNPDSLGKIEYISCLNWSTGCRHIDDSNNPGLNYQIWHWQNLPGKNNTKTFNGHQIRNLWAIHGDFDYIMEHSRSFFTDNYIPPNPKGISCELLYFAFHNFDKRVTSPTIMLQPEQAITIGAQIRNDDGNRSSIEWNVTGGMLTNNSWDHIIYKAPQEEGRYQVGLKIYGEDQLTCQGTIIVSKTPDSNPTGGSEY